MSHSKITTSRREEGLWLHWTETPSPPPAWAHCPPNLPSRTQSSGTRLSHFPRFCTLLSPHLNKCGHLLPPHSVIIMLLAVFPMLYFSSPWLIYLIPGRVYLLIPSLYFILPPLLPSGNGQFVPCIHESIFLLLLFDHLFCLSKKKIKYIIWLHLHVCLWGFFPPFGNPVIIFTITEILFSRTIFMKWLLEAIWGATGIFQYCSGTQGPGSQRWNCQGKCPLWTAVIVLTLKPCAGACLIGHLKLPWKEAMTVCVHPVPRVMSNFARLLSFSGRFHEVVLNLQTKAKGKQWFKLLWDCLIKPQPLEAFHL